jgi:hypothetical protein
MFIVTFRIINSIIHIQNQYICCNLKTVILTNPNGCFQDDITKKIEDTKWVIGIRKSKQDRQYNMANGKEQMNNDLQNTTQQNGATRIH